MIIVFIIFDLYTSKLSCPPCPESFVYLHCFYVVYILARNIL
jgi:hypothetical protein